MRNCGLAFAEYLGLVVRGGRLFLGVRSFVEFVLFGVAWACAMILAAGFLRQIA